MHAEPISGGGLTHFSQMQIYIKSIFDNQNMLKMLNTTQHWKLMLWSTCSDLTLASQLHSKYG